MVDTEDNFENKFLFYTCLNLVILWIKNMFIFLFVLLFFVQFEIQSTFDKMSSKNFAISPSFSENQGKHPQVVLA